MFPQAAFHMPSPPPPPAPATHNHCLTSVTRELCLWSDFEYRNQTAYPHLCRHLQRGAVLSELRGPHWILRPQLVRGTQTPGVPKRSSSGFEEGVLYSQEA